jgi:hypothetical protein
LASVEKIGAFLFGVDHVARCLRAAGVPDGRTLAVGMRSVNMADIISMSKVAMENGG